MSTLPVVSGRDVVQALLKNGYEKDRQKGSHIVMRQISYPFADGNKRVGFLAAYIFLELNGWELMASEAEAVAVVLALARGEMDEAGFSDWLKDNSLTGKA